MKEFLKYVVATIVGLLVFGIIITALGVMSLVGMVASTSATQSVPKNSVLVLKLDGSLDEQASDNLMNQLNGTTSIGLNDMLKAISKAKKSDKIRGIYIEAQGLRTNFAQLQELRGALADFRKSGKKIISYGETYGQGEYYLASVSDKVLLNPQGMILWRGLGGTSFYYKDALEKLGIKVIACKVGKYKSLPEMFTEERMSEANREQTERYLQLAWQQILTDVGKSRGISTVSLNTYADSLYALAAPELLLKRKMVDGLCYTDEVKDQVKKFFGLDKDDDISQVSASDLCNAPEDDEDDHVAIYYMQGDIVDQMLPSSFGSNEPVIDATKVCPDLEELADDDDVKAVVIRINSGGGSAYASEQIWHQIEKLKQKKPVVVSMSGMAASGGYYISCGANYIFAEPTTLTGSIGIFGLFTDASGLLSNKLGIKTDEVKTNRNTNILSLGQPLTPEQIGLLQAYIDRGYFTFKSRVAQGRKMTMAQVEERAQGHVVMGSDALKMKLVDELGGIDKAVAKAAKLAKLNKFSTVEYPVPSSWMEQLLNSGSGRNSLLDEQLKLYLGALYEPVMMLGQIEHLDMLQARAPIILINN
ncbi:MAG: signal peptide peptidase SppA [Prevotella sp.]|jgi:protease-4